MTKEQLNQKIFADSLGRLMSAKQIIPVAFESDPTSTKAEIMKQEAMSFSKFKKLAEKKGGYIVHD